MMKRTLGDLARTLGGRVAGDESLVITGVAGIREARPGELTFLANPRYEPHLRETRASAILVDKERPGLPVAQLVHENPYLAYLKAVKLFRGEPHRPTPGLHPSAVIAPGARVGEGVSIGPNVVIEDGAEVGDRAILLANVYLGHGARVGADSTLYPNVVVREECELGSRVVVHAGAVIGADGFGYVRDGGSYQKVPQVGNVIVGDDVEIGANTCIDRATTGTTLVARGVKIDNLVQIGHNVSIGEDAIVVAQVGISGSTEIGPRAILAGQAGLVGHIKIGENAVVGSQAGVTKSVPPNTQVSGYPAQPHSLARRINALVMRLPQMVERLQRLEERLESLEEEKSEADLGTRR